jgi:hypothetical protein
MGRSTSHHELPPSDDPVWVQLGDAVLKNLGTPKTVRQLKSWARDERLEIGRLVNALAWLDMRGLVIVDKTATPEPLWKRSDVPPPPAAQLAPLPKHCPKCHGMMKVEPQRVACIVCGKSIYPPPSPDEG